MKDALRSPGHRSCGAIGPLALVLAFGLSGGIEAQATYDYSVLRINEIIGSNGTQEPPDGAGRFRDMVEIYNGGDVTLPLAAKDPLDRLGLSDRLDPLPEELWLFEAGGYSNIPSKGFLVVFLASRPSDSLYCQLYSEFALNRDGSEPLVLWGPAKRDGEGKVILDDFGRPQRDVIDRVWVPPLPRDVSYGRYPDGAGPASVEPEEAPLHFRFYPPGETTFGTCLAVCPFPVTLGVCGGAPNGPGGNLKPNVQRTGSAKNDPAAGEAVDFRVRVRDDKAPTPESIASVLIHSWVDGAPRPTVEMRYDADLGVQSDPDRPLDLWTEWTGSLPGEPDGSLVQFVFEVRDKEGLWDRTPGNLCSALDPPVEGPCDPDFGGPGCRKDPTDVACGGLVLGERYVACDVPFQYVVGYTPRGSLIHVVINEVVPNQGLEPDGAGGYLRQGVLEDVTEPDCTVADGCPIQYPDCCKFQDDFIELFNASETESVDLSGLWLSDSPYRPRGWRFPAGSSIGPREYLIVWMDNDGGKCPDPGSVNPPCFWECPDPTDPLAGEYHVSFALDASGEQVYLFDTAEHGFGVVHGLEFQGTGINRAVALVPDGSRTGTWSVMDPTPRAPNASCPPGDPIFLRGDANSDLQVDITDPIFLLNYLFLGGGEPPCEDAGDADDSGVLDITDAVYVLNHLFQGGPELPFPGIEVPGCDPTPDDLRPCQSPWTDAAP